MNLVGVVVSVFRTVIQVLVGVLRRVVQFKVGSDSSLAETLDWLQVRALFLILVTASRDGRREGGVERNGN